MIQVIRLNKQFVRDARKSAPAQADPRDQTGGFQAVRDVSFRCGPGEVLGLLGPNGAGKTTTLRMLSTAIAPTSGEIHIDGLALHENALEIRRRIGFLSGSTGLYNRLTVRENIRYFGAAHGLGKPQLEARIAALLAQLKMESYADRRVDTLSAGMKQRAAIARTVVHEPRILILDEPTTGLDIIGSRVVMDFMQSYRERGCAILFSTHQLHEIETLCERVAIIDRGVSVYEGSVAALKTAGDGNLARAYLDHLAD